MDISSREKRRLKVATLQVILISAALWLFCDRVATAQSASVESEPAPTQREYLAGFSITNIDDTSFTYHLRIGTGSPQSGIVGRCFKAGVVLSGNDRSIVRVDGKRLRPRRVGRTPIIATYLDYSDTIALLVARVGRNLVVDFDTASFTADYMSKTYHTSTWDTVGGAARAEAVSSIEQGMTRREVDSLLSTHYLSGRTPRDRTHVVWPIDRMRRVHVTFDGDNVERVWIE
jgi:hypothetical protein